MRQHNTILLLILTLITISIIPSFAQKGEYTDKIWSKVQVKQDRIQEKLPSLNWMPASQVPTIYDFATVGPNIRPKPTTNTTQSEVSIDVHPTNKDIIFCSANATPWPVSGIYGTGVYWSLNGSTTWTGFDNPPFGSNSGDPASVIGPDGRFYENYISNADGQGVSVSTNNGANWTSYTVTPIPGPGGLADKNHYMVDKKAGSPYVNRSYCAWTDFGGSIDGQAALKYSTDFGATWSSIFNLSGTLSPGSHAQGVNIQTGPNGEVYVCYAIYDAWPGGEDAIGFSKSTNGGATWTSARVYSATNFGIRGNLSSKANIRVSSFPSMAVDRSGGAYNGTIYITWPQRGVTPAGSDPDIVMIKSSNGGTNWTTPIRVNNDPINNAKDQYYPWCTVDQSTGRFMLVFYDSRNVVNSQAEVYMATSTDGGVTYENFKVSDQAHTPAPITGLAGGYAGDYIGVAGLDNVAFPYWGDNRTGNYQGWTAKVSYGPPCPVAVGSNPAPVNNATNVSSTLPQLSWTNGAGATQCEVWFGAGVMSMVYSGALISSWTLPSALTYNTNYNWQIIGKNDSCSVSGEIWNFTTELSPGLVFVEPFNNLNNWTAIGPLGITNWSVQSTTNAGGSSPELRLNWSPEFQGLSKLKSNAITVQSNRHYSVQFKHMLDWYGNPAPNMGLGVSYDNGATYTPVWNITPTGNVGPATVNASFITPASGSPETVSMNLVFFCNGNSFNIDYWYIDDLSLNDDDFLLVNNPASFTATPISEQQINLSFTPNANNNNVVIVWNQTGVFTTPTGTPPAAGQPFAGGTLLYNGITSPVAHTGLTASTTYYYKAFSFQSSSTTYSSGMAANASTLAATTFQLTVNVANGWNLVSIPGLQPVNQNVSTWWIGRDPTASVFKFNGGYEAVTDVQPGTGYWMKHIGPNLYNTGDEWPAGGIQFVNHSPITAALGWNLFGGYEQTVSAAGVTTTPPGLITGQIYEYQGGYIVATSITPGYAYFVKLTGAGQINIPSGSQAPVKGVKLPTDGLGKIIITDNSGKSYTLYAAAEGADLADFDLPPLPPQGIFDIRFASHRSAENLNSTPKLIEMMGVQYPIKIKADGISIILSDESGREIERVQDGQEITINSSGNKLYASENIVPKEYSLEQNYPNPFNPGTTISFSIPEDTKNVKLIIYNSLGEVVAELVNSELQTGNYQYRWDAGNMSSGLYIYQIVTEKFSATRKMILLK